MQSFSLTERPLDLIGLSGEWPVTSCQMLSTEAASLAEVWISALVTAPPTPASSFIHAKTLNIAAQVSSKLPVAHPSLWAGGGRRSSFNIPTWPAD